LKKISFRYKKEPSEVFGFIYRPVVEVYLKIRQDEWSKVLSYADSGADITIFPRSVCEILGLRIEDGQQSIITGVSGEEIRIYMHTIMIRIGDEEIEIRVGFAEREDVPYLLGRTDILTHFDVLFKDDRVVFIKK